VEIDFNPEGGSCCRFELTRRGEGGGVLCSSQPGTAWREKRVPSRTIEGKAVRRKGSYSFSIEGRSQAALKDLATR